jgi:hypothetical protein
MPNSYIRHETVILGPGWLVNRALPRSVPWLAGVSLCSAFLAREEWSQDLRADRLLSQAQASGGDPLQLTHLFGISDPAAIRYCAETGQLSYDARQALEGAAGSAGRTESTSASS